VDAGYGVEILSQDAMMQLGEFAGDGQYWGEER